MVNLTLYQISIQFHRLWQSYNSYDRIFLHLLSLALWSLKILFSDPENQPSPINSSEREIILSET